MESELGKMAPVLAVLGLVGYGYWMHAYDTLAPRPANAGEQQTAGDPLKTTALPAPSRRDPFRPPLAKAAAASADVPQDGPLPVAPPPPVVDEAVLVRQLSVEATCAQGQQRMALIGGRLYVEGDALLVSENSK